MSETRRREEERGWLVGGAMLIALGFVFLLRRFVDFAAWDGLIWPFFIIGPGLFLFVAMFVGGRGAGRLAVPASVVTTIGVILLCQSIFDRFDTWAYAWALFPTAVGFGTAIAGLWEGSAALVRA